MMKDFEKALSQVDFSAGSDLKSRLAEKLFSQKTTLQSRSPFAVMLTDDEAELVAAAQDLYIPDEPGRKTF